MFEKIQKIGTKSLTLTEYRYASVDGCLPEFSYVNSSLPPLNYTEIPVPLTTEEGNSYLLEDVDTVKKYRYVYTVVVADSEEEIMLLTLSNAHYKIWFNGAYVGVNPCYDLFAFFLRPQRGKNLLIFEISPDDVWKYDFNNQVVLRSAEERNPDSFLCDSCVEFFKRAQVFHTPDARNGNLSVICLPRRFSFVKRAVLDLVDDFGKSLLQQELQLGMEYSFSARELRIKSPETKRIHLSLDLSFEDGSSVKRNQDTLLRDFEEEAPQLAARWEALKHSADPYTVALVEDQYKRLLSEPLQNTPDEAFSLLRLRRILEGIEQGKPPFYREQKSFLLSYRSALDGAYRRIRISLPEHPAKNPGLLVFCNFSGNGMGDAASALLDRRCDVMIADFFTAGVSVGNPVSEAILLEGLEELKKLYPFDEQRVYFYGYCANGYTVWSFARNFPHKVAGFACTESLPPPTGLENFDNAKTTSYYWEKAKHPVLRKLASRPAHQVIPIRNACHAFMLFYLYKMQSYRFLDDSSPQYPETVRFYTQRLRHNRSFWVTLNNIRKGKSFARVAAEIVDSQNIRIRLTNCDDITLDVSPQMAPSFRVTINGVPVQVTADLGQTVRFVKSPSWKISKEAPSSLSRKGTGLLDVYYGPMRILRENTAVAEEIAQHFSQPEAVSFSPKLLVQYPVYTQDTFPEEEKTSHLILINTNAVCGMTIDFPIKTDKDGCEYQGKRFLGDYCILQVVPNPFDYQRSILQVFSNNLEKFKNHLLLRKVILPSMLTGISPYWNAEGLILTENGIVSIQEW